MVEKQIRRLMQINLKKMLLLLTEGKILKTIGRGNLISIFLKEDVI